MSPTPFAAGCAVQAEGAKESLMKEDKPALADPERFKNCITQRRKSSGLSVMVGARGCGRGSCSLSLEEPKEGKPLLRQGLFLRTGTRLEDGPLGPRNSLTNEFGQSSACPIDTPEFASEVWHAAGSWLRIPTRCPAACEEVGVEAFSAEGGRPPPVVAQPVGRGARCRSWKLLLRSGPPRSPSPL